MIRNQQLSFSFNHAEDLAVLEKDALIFVEGQHKDRQGNTHVFSAERVQNIANNTIQKISQGVRLPFQRDHKKTTDANIGDLEGSVFTKIITAQDLPNPKHTHLLGKLGVFANRLVVKGTQAVEEARNGLIKTLSAGIDPATESFIEISATPFPAIIGPALFSQFGEEGAELLFMDEDMAEERDDEARRNPTSMEEALGIEKESNKAYEEYHKLAAALGKVLNNLYLADEETLKGKNPIEASYEALEFFNKRIEEIFSLIEEESEQAALPVSSRDDGMAKRKLGFSSNNSQIISFGGRFR